MAMSIMATAFLISAATLVSAANTTRRLEATSRRGGQGPAWRPTASTGICVSRLCITHPGRISPATRSCSRRCPTASRAQVTYEVSGTDLTRQLDLQPGELVASAWRHHHRLHAGCRRPCGPSWSTCRSCSNGSTLAPSDHDRREERMAHLRAARRARARQGAALVAALIIVLVVFALGAAWLQLADHQSGASTYDVNRQHAIDAADAGLATAVAALTTQPTLRGSGA